MPFLAALVLTLPAWAPILHPHLDLLVLPDGDGHLHRTLLLKEMILGGDWYPRWFSQHYGGYGYPTLNFYAPSVYYLTLLLAVLIPGAGLESGFQALGGLAALAIIGGSFSLSWRVFRHGPAAVLTAAAAAYAPYLLQGNLFIRGALPETLGLGLAVWLLVACHGLWHSVTAGSKHAAPWWWFTAGVSTFLLLTHNLASLLAAALCLAWLACLWVWRPSWRAIFLVGGAGLLSVALTAFFWFPAVAEAGLVQVERMQRGQLHYKNWFILWPGFHPDAWGLQERSPWTVGFPIDLHMIYPHSIYGTPKASLWQAIAVAFAVCVLTVAAWFHASNRAQRTFVQDGRRLAVIATLFGVSVAVAGYALVFDWALPYWERFPALRTLQFPMRLLGPVALGVALAVGGAVAMSLPVGRRSWVFATSLAAALAFMGTGHRLVRIDSSRAPSVGVPYLIEQQRLQRGWTYGESGEFLPKSASYIEWHEGEARGFWLYERMFPEASWVGGRILPWEGEIGISDVVGGGLWTSAEVETAHGGTLAFHQLFFPGWRAWVDGKPAPLKPAQTIDEQAVSPGFILVEVPPGKHTVAIRFGPDGVRIIGAGISLAALLALGVWLWRRCATAVEGRASQSTWPITVLTSAHRYLPATGIIAVAAVLLVRLLVPLWPPAARSAQDNIVVLNVVDALLAGRAAAAAPSGAALGPDKFLDVRFLTLQAQDRPLKDAGPRTRRWLFTHPPSEVAVDFRVPEGAFFQTSLALNPVTWLKEVGDGVRLMATVTPVGGAATTILDASVNPRAQGEQRRWLDLVADLRPWSGQQVRLTLRAEGREEPSFDWAGWGEPVVVSLDALTAARLVQSTEQTGAVALRS